METVVLIHRQKEVIAMSSFKVFNGKIDIYGDLHLSSTYTGTHKEYVSECYRRGK